MASLHSELENLKQELAKSETRRQEAEHEANSLSLWTGCKLTIPFEVKRMDGMSGEVRKLMEDQTRQVC